MKMDELLHIPILDSKSEIEINGETIIDLCQKTVNFSIKNTPVIKIIIVNEKLAGKPHLISKLAYQSENYCGIVENFNGISNPLSTDKGNILYVPNLQVALGNIQAKQTQRTNDSKRLFQKKLKPEQLKAIQAISEIEDPRKPNMVADGTDAITIVDDSMILGTDVTDVKRCGKNLSDNQVLSERIKEAVRLKIESTLSQSA